MTIPSPNSSNKRLPILRHILISEVLKGQKDVHLIISEVFHVTFQIVEENTGFFVTINTFGDTNTFLFDKIRTYDVRQMTS